MGALPPGQHEVKEAPRFGLPWVVKRVPELAEATLSIGGDQTQDEFVIDMDALKSLKRLDQTSDLHCVTTWSWTDLRWGGWRVRDVFEQLVRPRLRPDARPKFLIFRGYDGFEAPLVLEDALADDAVIADSLNGAPLDFNHGAPLRLVVPKHYGYKNIKHLREVRVCSDLNGYRRATLPFMDHLRARVALEERGQLPAWLLRYLYKPFIPIVHRASERALRRSGR